MTFNLNSPIASLTLESRPEHWLAITVAWVLFWGAVSVTAVYAYAFILPEYIGFEHTALVGIAITALAANGGGSA